MRKITKADFIKQCKIKYKGKYDYKNINFINMNTKIQIYCKKCNEFFEKTPKNFLRRSQECQKCKVIIRNNLKNLKNFINKAKSIHGNKFKYEHLKDYNYTKIKIYCNKCKVFFTQRPSSHLSGCGHLKCSLRKTQAKFIEESIKIHNNRYIYDKAIYVKNNIKIDIFCKKHKYFKQTPAHHLKGHGCPKCNISKGENIIDLYLTKNNIEYTFQKYHQFLSNKLYFDFYIKEYDLYIEFDGIQHFKETNFFNNNLSENIHKDILKNNFINHKNKKLLRISYKEEKSIEDILKKYLKKSIKNNIYYSNPKIYNDILQHNL